MTYRTYPAEIAADADLQACALDRGADPNEVAQLMARISDEKMAGLLATVVDPKAWGWSADDWRSAWPMLANGTDPQVESLMCWLASRTEAVALDDGGPP